MEASGVQVVLKLRRDEDNDGGKGRLDVDEQQDPGSILPSTADLAQSFLDSEPKEETEELQAALSQQSDILSDDGDDDSELGLNEGVSLPSFVAGFLKGISDRLQLSIKDVSIRVEMEVEEEAVQKQPSPGKFETIAGLFTIDNIAIDGVAPEYTEDERRKPGKRLITLSQINAMLVSDEGLFSNYARFNPSNSSAEETPLEKDSIPTKVSSPPASASPASLSPAESSSSSNAMHQLAQSTIFGLTSSAGGDGLEETQDPQALRASIISEDGRFSDADSDDDDPLDEDPPAEYLQGLDDQYEDSQSQDYTSLQDTVYYGSLDTINDSPTHSPQGRTGYGNEASATRRAHSVESPSQSMYSQFHSIREEYSSPVSSKILNDDIRGSTLITGEATTPTLHHSLPHPDENEDQQHDPTQNSNGPGDLSESRIFSRDEARSIYMSVMSQHSTEPVLNMPGAWDSDPYTQTDIPSQRDRSSTPTPRSPGPEDRNGQGASTTSHEKSDVEPGSQHLGQEPMAAEEPSLANTSGRDFDVAKRFLDIREITIWLPSLSEATSEEAVPESSKEPVDQMDESTANLADSTILGIDSSHARLPHKRIRGGLSVSALGAKAGHQPEPTLDEADLLTAEKKAQAIEVKISSINVGADIACGWLLVKAGQKISSALKLDKADKSDEAVTKSRDAPLSIPIDLSLETCSIKFLDHLSSQALGRQKPELVASVSSSISTGGIILHADFSDVRFQSLTAGRNMKYAFIIGEFTLSYMSEALISFDESLKMRESTRDVSSPISRDISILVVKSPESATVNLTTLPLHLSLDLKKLDESIDWLGALNTVLDLGSSIASTTTIKAEKQDPILRRRSVHFEHTPAEPSPTPGHGATSFKLNSRIGGIVVQLVGENSCLKFETTAVKMIGRRAVLGVQVDKVKLTGPHIDLYDKFLDNDTAATVRLTNIRVEYVNTPSEGDLDRLLTLLTPSKDKYDDDDDIMLDTLFRQRKKGPVLRVSTGETYVDVDSIAGLQPLTHLADEMLQLSRVAKYLPQNDSPGILILARVKELNVRVAIGGQIGNINLTSQGAELGHVSFPSLIACRVSSISVKRGDSEELLAPAIPHDTKEKEGQSSLPMLMARFIADEMDPTIKLKIFNTRVEYSVDSLSAFLGINADKATAEMIAANMAQSVLNLAEPQPQPQTSELEPSASSSLENPQTPSFPWKLSASLKDCLIGLNPAKSSAKALVVFTSAQFTGAVNEDSPSEAYLEIQRANMMLIDSTEHIGAAGSTGWKKSNSNPGAQVQALEQMGYLSVCSISSASVSVKIIQLDDKGEKSLDVELRDDLLILETCADSTQTLVSVLSGLAPPTPPSKESKYRTETVPAEDIFDIFTDIGFSDGSMLRESGSATAVADSLGRSEQEKEPVDEQEYLTNFHPFISGVDDRGFDEDDTAQMAGENDYLTGNLQSNTHMSPDLETLDFQDNHFARKSAVEGTAHRWDASRNVYSLSNEVKLHRSPLRVRVRDVHFIWNLYDGYDWQGTRDVISKVVKDVQSKATEKRAASRRLSRDFDEEAESVVGDFLFNSVYIEIPSHSDPKIISNDINRKLDDRASETASFATTSTMTVPSNQAPVGKRERLRLSRSKHHKMTIELSGVSGDLVLFPEGTGETQSSTDIRIHDLEIFDHMPQSAWKTFATYMKDHGEREVGTSMIHIEVLNVKPVADLSASELILKVSSCHQYLFLFYGLIRS